MEIVNTRQKLTATLPIEADQFRSIEKRFDDLLVAAEGLKQLGNLMDIAATETDIPVPNVGYLVESMGKHIQNVRNEAAEKLEPVFKSFDAEPIGY